MVRKVRVYSRALRSPQRLAETLHQERHLPTEEDKHGESRKGAWADRKLHEIARSRILSLTTAHTIAQSQTVRTGSFEDLQGRIRKIQRRVPCLCA
jgi:hypothetical protein